jgi:hypothetical protein
MENSNFIYLSKTNLATAKQGKARAWEGHQARAFRQFVNYMTMINLVFNALPLFQP